MKKYNSYKDSNVEWLGEIPENWKAKRIKDVFSEFGSGTTPKASNPRYYENGYIPWLNTSDLNNGLVFGTKTKITKEAIEETSLKLYPKGSLAIAMYGQGKTRATVGLIDFPFTTNQASCVMFKPRGINIKYLLFWFNYKYENIRAINVGASQPNMNQDFVRFMQIHYPPFIEQTAIAKYLDSKTQAIDKKTNLLEQKITHYKDLRKSLVRHVITKGLDKNVKLKDSGIDWIGKMPEHWEVFRFKSFAKTIKGKNMEMSNINFENSLPLLSLEYLRNDNVKFDTFCFTKDKSLIASENDLIVVWDGAAAGEILKAKHGYVSSTIAKIDLNKRKISSRYFYFLKDNIEYMLQNIPTGMGIPHLNPTILNNYPCPSPPLNEQLEIADYLEKNTNSIASIITNIEIQINTLKELRKTLINDVVTGKIKVI